jgi:conjugal transfer pilus assembly protein TrbC
MEKKKLLYLVTRLIFCTCLIAAQYAHANGIDQQSEQSSQFKTIIEAVTKKIDDGKEFYKKLVESAQIKQAQHATEVQDFQKDSVVEQIVTNYQNQETIENKSKGLIVFVSFSMPRELLWDYQQQIRKYGGRMVLRGLVEDSFKKTIAKMRLDENRALTLDINPKLFEEYGVKQVPTIVISNNQYFDKFTGSVSISHALDQSNELGEAKIVSAKYLERGEK